MKKISSVLLLGIALAILSGCGGGGGGEANGNGGGVNNSGGSSAGGQQGGAGNTATYTIGGTVTGLNANTVVILSNNGNDTLNINANGSFKFSTPVANNGSYSVKNLTPPGGQGCTVSNAAGSNVTANVTNIVLTCSSDLYIEGGTVTGLNPGAQFTMLNNGTDPVSVSANGTFTFTTPVSVGDGYSITLRNQPAGQYCAVLYGAGGGVGALVVTVSCDEVPVPLYFFQPYYSSTDGFGPTGQLLQASDGNFYGITIGGGTTNLGANGGTVFKYVPSVGETLLWSFGNPGDGANPQGPLIQGSDGNLYGTTNNGGAFGNGTIFKLTLAGQETVLYSFPDPDSYVYPKSIMQGNDGNLYGIAAGGNPDYGFIFQLTPQGTFSIVHSFVGSDGACPSYLMQASDGNFYGTAGGGGTYWNGLPCETAANSDIGIETGVANGGTLFKMTPSGNLTVLHSFGAPGDGQGPQFVMVGSDGNFYGTAATFGAHQWGAVFKVTPEGDETLLHSFGGIRDGYTPNPALIQGSDGNFYGTTFSGGFGDEGILYKITPSGDETIVTDFGPTETQGTTPVGIIFGRDGHIYGTTVSGVIFELTYWL